MDDRECIFVVDDDSFMHDMFADALGERYRIISAESGEDALLLAQTKDRPSLIIMDVEMPGIDGYETCRRFKALDATNGVPVIFVSSHDEIEERIKGYEAGGEDYIIKPFNTQELAAKVAQLLKAVSERANLKEMVNYATSTAMSAMTSIGEMGALIESVKKFSATTDDQELAVAVLAGLANYGLDGVVQIRMPERVITLTKQGEASALEVSVINHMSKMDRISSFKNRMSVHYQHVTMLVTNMPVDDLDRCGRLRDHLAMLVESADMKVSGIIAENKTKRLGAAVERGAAIERAVTNITRTLVEVDAAQRQRQVSTARIVNEFTYEMEMAYLRVGLSDSHEKFMTGVLQSGIDKILEAQSKEVDIQDKMTSIIRELKDIAG